MKTIKKLLFLYIMLLLFISNSYAKMSYIRGAELMQTGVSPVAMGLMGGYATENEYLDLLPVNPAVAAGLIRPNLLFSFSGLENSSARVSALTAFYCQPTKVGIFSAGTTVIKNKKLELDTYVQPALIFTKAISTFFNFGFNIHVDFIKSLSTNVNTNQPSKEYTHTGAGLDVGMQYYDNNHLDQPIGFGGTKIAFLIRNLGYNPRFQEINKKRRLKSFALQAGYSFKFIDIYGEKGGFGSRLYFDFNLQPLPAVFNARLLAGLKISINANQGLLDELAFISSFSIIEGEKIGTHKIGRWAAGVLLNLRLKFTALHLNYSITPAE
ncbi:MAG TPA: hypothetical protein VKS21_13400, partial [Spirochaetota bacterium]|nr:hypothetical protein [Spirochaetota bacterium]